MEGGREWGGREDLGTDGWVGGWEGGMVGGWEGGLADIINVKHIRNIMKVNTLTIQTYCTSLVVLRSVVQDAELLEWEKRYIWNSRVVLRKLRTLFLEDSSPTTQSMKCLFQTTHICISCHFLLTST